MCIFNIVPEMGNSLLSNEAIELLSRNQPSSSPSKNGQQQTWFYHTQPPLASYLQLPPFSADTCRRQDHWCSRMDRCQPLHIEINRRWSEQRPISLPPSRSSALLGQLHRSKPLRFQLYTVAYQRHTANS